MDGKSTIEGAGLVLSALKFARDVLQSGVLGRKDKNKVKAEAERLIVLAQIPDMNEEIKKHAAYKTGTVAKKRPATKIIRRRAQKKSTAVRKK